MQQHKSDSQKIPEILNQVVPAGYNYNKGQRMFKMKGGLWTPIFLQGGSTLRKLLGFIRSFSCKRSTSQKAVLRAHEAALRITEDSGQGTIPRQQNWAPVKAHFLLLCFQESDPTVCQHLRGKVGGKENALLQRQATRGQSRLMSKGQLATDNQWARGLVFFFPLDFQTPASDVQFIWLSDLFGLGRVVHCGRFT